LMFFFNFIFFISGLTLVVIGAMIKSDYGDYFSYADHKFATAEVFIIVIGVIVFFIGFFGCCGALKENYCMVTVFAVMLSVIFVLEIAAGILGYQYRGKVEVAANKGLKTAVENYDHQKGARQLLDWAQGFLKCCGKTSAEDYKTSVHRCRAVHNTTHVVNGVASCHEGRQCIAPLYPGGCKQKFVYFVKKNLYVIGGVAVGVAFVQVVGVVLACCLMRAIKHDYEVMG